MFIQLSVTHHLDAATLQRLDRALDQGDRFVAVLEKVADLLAQFVGASHIPHHVEGGTFMFIVKDTQPDSRYKAAFQVVDAEGQPVPTPAGVKVAIASDNPDVVAIAPDDPANPVEGGIHFGAPGVANVTAQVTLEDGTLIGSFGAQFTVTAGDPAAIAGGKFTVDGIDEAA